MPQGPGAGAASGSLQVLEQLGRQADGQACGWQGGRWGSSGLTRRVPRRPGGQGRSGSESSESSGQELPRGRARRLLAEPSGCGAAGGAASWCSPAGSLVAASARMPRPP